MGAVVLSLALMPIPTARAQSEKLTQGVVYDHEREIMVCLSSDSAKNLYLNFQNPNVRPAGCFRAKLLNFVPKYKVENIELISPPNVFGFVFGTSESVIPRVGAIMNDLPIYVVTSSTVIDDRQQEVLQPDLE